MCFIETHKGPNLFRFSQEYFAPANIFLNTVIYARVAVADECTVQTNEASHCLIVCGVKLSL
jgi:hypothetical protein